MRPAWAREVKLTIQSEAIKKVRKRENEAVLL
jgi:hypothetical protein